MTEMNWQDFNRRFIKLLKKKKGKNVVRSRYNLETISFKKRIPFIISILEKLTAEKYSCIYKVLYWENDNVVNNILEKLGDSNLQYSTPLSYKNGVKPGEIFFETKVYSISIISGLLLRHFNFELAKKPSLNIRVQLCINLHDYNLLFDFYDDRGFDLYWIKIDSVEKC